MLANAANIQIEEADSSGFTVRSGSPRGGFKSPVYS